MILFILCTILGASDISALALNEVRVSFYEAATDKNERRDFLNLMESLPKTSAVIKAYYGASQAMMAEVVINPYSKLSYFNDGKESIEAAIAENPTQAELCYVRYLIQSNAPDFLDYSSEIMQDLQVIYSAIERSPNKESWMVQFEKYRALQRATLEAELNK